MVKTHLESNIQIKDLGGDGRELPLCVNWYFWHNSCAKMRLFSSVSASSQQKGFSQLPGAGSGNPPLPESFCCGAGARLSLLHPEPVSGCGLLAPQFSSLQEPGREPSVSQCHHLDAVPGVHLRDGGGGYSCTSLNSRVICGCNRVSAVPTFPPLSVPPS